MGTSGRGGRRDRHRGRGQGRRRAGRAAVLRLREPFDEPERRDGVHRHLDQHRPMTEIPDLKVTPDRYLTYRYAGASGDFNPIHIDEEFAQSVGLPGRILHGLWTMAQVARAQTEAGGGPESLERLAVQFRGMGFPEQEITITSAVREENDGEVVVSCDAEQGGK